MNASAFLDAGDPPDPHHPGDGSRLRPDRLSPGRPRPSTACWVERCCPPPTNAIAQERSRVETSAPAMPYGRSCPSLRCCTAAPRHRTGGDDRGSLPRHENRPERTLTPSDREEVGLGVRIRRHNLHRAVERLVTDEDLLGRARSFRAAARWQAPGGVRRARPCSSGSANRLGHGLIADVLAEIAAGDTHTRLRSGRATAARRGRAGCHGARSSGWVGAGGLEVVAVGAEVGAAGVLGAAAHVGVERSGFGSEPPAVGAGEGELGVGVALDGPAAFVDEVVVFPAEPAEVPGVGGAVVGPVLDVVEVTDAASAAREAAGAVAVGGAAAEPPRWGAAGSADADAGAVGAVDVELDLAVAQQATDALGGDGDAVDGAVALAVPSTTSESTCTTTTVGSGPGWVRTSLRARSTRASAWRCSAGSHRPVMGSLPMRRARSSRAALTIAPCSAGRNPR